MKQLTDPLIDKNPVAVHILGICSALAVTTSMATALTMSVALTVVVTLAAGLISALRSHIPNQIRIIVQLTIIATLVILADLLLQGFAHDMSQRLTVFVSLIATNCIVLGRTEAYAMHNPPLPSMIDALGSGCPCSFCPASPGLSRCCPNGCNGLRWPRPAPRLFPAWSASIRWARPGTMS